MSELGILKPTVVPHAPVIRPVPSPAPIIPPSVELVEADLYSRLKSLQRHLETLELQEKFIKEDQKSLKREYIRAQEEVKRIQSVPLVIGQFLEPIDQHTGIVGSTTGSNYVVRILSTLDRELLKPSSSVALHRHSNALVDILPPEADSSIQMLQASEKPDVTYADVGGLDIQKQEIREAVELPLQQMDLYKQIGIDPPRGVLLYGPPGTGKTMLVKAVANSTSASFIRVVGSEFVQKYLGEGPRMVRDVFRMARENSPCIIFIDEVDAIATKRFDAQTGADREVQRILLELLNQMDGFDQTSNVKVIMATNRADTLDPALLRPGRLDRKIEFPSLKDRRQRRLIFSTVSSKMSLSPEVDLDTFILRPDAASGAQIAAIMQDAGLIAVRKSRYVILQSDIEEAYQSLTICRFTHLLMIQDKLKTTKPIRSNFIDRYFTNNELRNPCIDCCNVFFLSWNFITLKIHRSGRIACSLPQCGSVASFCLASWAADRSCVQPPPMWTAEIPRGSVKEMTVAQVTHCARALKAARAMSQGLIPVFLYHSHDDELQERQYTGALHLGNINTTRSSTEKCVYWVYTHSLCWQGRPDDSCHQ